MMSEILFRGKDNNDVWQKGFYCVFNDEAHRIYSGYAETDCGDYYPEYDTVSPETVGQYTGLIDKNGVRIFEKDVISIPYRDMSGFTEYQKALVFWDNERLGWCVKFMDNEVLYLNDVFDPHSSIDIEIVDNIIDNKELAELWA